MASSPSPFELPAPRSKVAERALLDLDQCRKFVCSRLQEQPGNQAQAIQVVQDAFKDYMTDTHGPKVLKPKEEGRGKKGGATTKRTREDSTTNNNNNTNNEAKRKYISEAIKAIRGADKTLSFEAAIAQATRQWEASSS
jgi:hypothetical protein